jgi:5-methylcytosine-specific restriction enzyme subunit McrC
MDELITVYEDRSRKLNLSASQRADILLMRSLWDKYSLSLQADDTLLARHYVGFAVRNQTRLQVIPKVYSTVAFDEGQKAESVRAVLRMIKYSEFPTFKELPPQEFDSTESDLLEFFIALFVKSFLRQYDRDVFREYVTVEADLQFVRGRILFPESLRRHHGLQHVHAVQFHEFTANNLLNRILKTTLWRVHKISRNSDNRRALRKALHLMEDIDFVVLSDQMFELVKFHRQNEAYRPVLNLARLFYNKAQPSLYGGNQFTFGFLVPLNDLFELFVFRLLEEHLLLEEFEVSHEPPQYLALDSNNCDMYLLKPDIVIYDDDRPVMILDAKYKDPYTDKGLVHPEDSDVYQLLTYAVAHKCNLVGLVYPMFRGRSNQDVSIASFTVSSAMGGIRFFVFNVDILSDDMELTKARLCTTILDLLNHDTKSVPLTTVIANNGRKVSLGPMYD